MGKRALSIELSKEEREYLELQTRARTIQAQTVTRTRILLLRADAISIDAISDKAGLNRCSVMLCLKKFKEGGIENALFDAPGRGRNAEADIKPQKNYVRTFPFLHHILFTLYSRLIIIRYNGRQTGSSNTITGIPAFGAASNPAPLPSSLLDSKKWHLHSDDKFHYLVSYNTGIHSHISSPKYFFMYSVVIIKNNKYFCINQNKHTKKAYA